MMKAWHLHHCRCLGLRLARTSQPALAVGQVAITMMGPHTVERTIDPRNASFRNLWMNQT
jgi:hypothetical protein